MPKRPRPHGPDPKGADGLSDRERAFAEDRRRDPTAPYWISAQRAGFLGDNSQLSERGRVLMKKAAVLAIIHAPADADPLEGEDGNLDNDKMLLYIKKRMLTILRGSGDPKDILSAADKLISTIPGGYAPAGIDLKHKFGMEDIVRLMGGAPPDIRQVYQGTPTKEITNGLSKPADT